MNGMTQLLAGRRLCMRLCRVGASLVCGRAAVPFAKGASHTSGRHVYVGCGHTTSHACVHYLLENHAIIIHGRELSPRERPSFSDKTLNFLPVRYKDHTAKTNKVANSRKISCGAASGESPRHREREAPKNNTSWAHRTHVRR